MHRLLTLLALGLVLGCGSSDKKPKFEAAESSETTGNEKKDVPDWMKAESKPDTGQQTVSSDNVPVAPQTPATQGTSTQGTAKSPLAESMPGKQPGTPESGVAETGTGLPPTTPQLPGDITGQSSGSTGSAGENTAMIAKLMESYQKSQEFLQNSQSSGNQSEQELIRIRDQYAKMVEEWLAIADQLIERDLRPKDRVTVVSLKQLAHQSLVAFNRPEHEQLLFDFAETLKDDNTPEIRKIYQFLKLQQPFTEILRGNPIDEDAFFDRFEKITSYWRDDYAVYQSVENWLNELYAVNRPYYLKALEIATKNFSQSTDTQVMARSANLKDRLVSAKLGFDLAVQAVINEAPNAPAELLDTANRLLAQPDLSLYTLMQVIQAGHELEGRGEYDAVKKYFEQLKAATAELTNPKMKETVDFYVDSALKRYELLGKPIKVDGMVPRIEAGQFLRSPIDFSQYRGKVVILFFWAIENQPSYIVLNQLDDFYMANQDKDLAMIGVNADRTMDTISRIMAVEMGQKKRKWTHLMPSTPEVLGLQTAMAKRCGVDSMPYNIIIDKDGKVDSYRVYGVRLQETVSRLLGEPVNEIFIDARKGKGVGANKPQPDPSRPEPPAPDDAAPDDDTDARTEGDKPAPEKKNQANGGEQKAAQKQEGGQADSGGSSEPGSPAENDASGNAEPRKTDAKTDDKDASSGKQ